MLFAELQWEVLGSFQIVMGFSGILSCCLREGSQFFKLQGALRVSSQVTAWE